MTLGTHCYMMPVLVRLVQHSNTSPTRKHFLRRYPHMPNLVASTSDRVRYTRSSHQLHIIMLTSPDSPRDFIKHVVRQPTPHTDTLAGAHPRHALRGLLLQLVLPPPPFSVFCFVCVQQARVEEALAAVAYHEGTILCR